MWVIYKTFNPRHWQRSYLEFEIKMTQQSLPIAFAITLGLSSFLGYPTLAQTPISTLLSQTPPQQPPTPPPDKETKPAGGGGL